MNAITFKAPGDPTVLELVHIPVPALQSPHDILVKIKGSALNPVDYKVSHHHVHRHQSRSHICYSSATVKVG